MALVVLLRGVNVGGHRTFRPAELARELHHLGTVNIGAAGTFVVRRPVSRARLRAEFARRLPFDTAIAICPGRDITRLLSHGAFAELPPGPMVRFVTVLTRAPRAAPDLPLRFPPTGRWLMQLLAREGRYVLGVYRRHMKVIGYLGDLDRILGAGGTTRNWNTLTTIGRVLDR